MGGREGGNDRDFEGGWRRKKMKESFGNKWLFEGEGGRKEGREGERRGRESQIKKYNSRAAKDKKKQMKYWYVLLVGSPSTW